MVPSRTIGEPGVIRVRSIFQDFYKSKTQFSSRERGGSEMRGEQLPAEEGILVGEGGGDVTDRDRVGFVRSGWSHESWNVLAGRRRAGGVGGVVRVVKRRHHR